jgi:hypothetical protein
LALKDTSIVEDQLRSDDPEVVKEAMKKVVTLKHRSQGID